MTEHLVKFSNLCFSEVNILFQHSIRPDRYVPLFGEFFYNPSKWRPSIPFVEQLKAFQELIDEGKVMFVLTKLDI